MPICRLAPSRNRALSSGSNPQRPQALYNVFGARSVIAQDYLLSWTCVRLELCAVLGVVTDLMLNDRRMLLLHHLRPLHQGRQLFEETCNSNC